MVKKSLSISLFITAFCSCIAFADSAIINKIFGPPATNQLMFLPFGYHLVTDEKGNQHNNENYLVAVNYKGLGAGTFINSFHHRVYFIATYRTIYQWKNLQLNYLLGIMHGYGDQLHKSLGPTLGHDPGPIFALNFDVAVTPKFSLDLATYGFGILAGFSYRF